MQALPSEVGGIGAIEGYGLLLMARHGAGKRSVLMGNKLTTKEIAEGTGLAEGVVGSYLTDSEQRPYGSWVVYFDPKIPEDLRAGLKGFFTFEMPSKD